MILIDRETEILSIEEIATLRSFLEEKLTIVNLIDNFLIRKWKTKHQNIDYMAGKLLLCILKDYDVCENELRKMNSITALLKRPKFFLSKIDTLINDSKKHDINIFTLI